MIIMMWMLLLLGCAFAAAVISGMFQTATRTLLLWHAAHVQLHTSFNDVVCVVLQLVWRQILDG
jgi:hypothetical protein